jgi:hypothetical protein
MRHWTAVVVTLRRFRASGCVDELDEMLAADRAHELVTVASPPSVVYAKLQNAQAFRGLGWRSIQDVPNLSLSIAKRDAKNVSCIGMKI